jgi:ribosome-associated protein
MEDKSTIKEKSLRPKETAPRPVAAEPTSAVIPVIDEPRVEPIAEPMDERIALALHSASDKKALDLVLIDLREIATFTDYFVISSGANQRQVQAIADEVVEKLKKAGTPAARVEGYRTAEWVLVDYGDFIVHVFDGQARKFYDLERLWREGKRIALPPDLTNESAGSLRTES